MPLLQQNGMVFEPQKGLVFRAAPVPRMEIKVVLRPELVRPYLKVLARPDLVRPFRQTIQDAIESAMILCGGNMSLAAKSLGLVKYVRENN